MIELWGQIGKSDLVGLELNALLSAEDAVAFWDGVAREANRLGYA